ncbi:hypothetical protein ACQUSY_08720 [Microbacterium sp. YY-03]|uniref:hypothetical protein n=1 Tax=Microbacterium sp. YY-03 TaxID=3421636 RepID=UPI003D163C99
MRIEAVENPLDVVEKDDARFRLVLFADETLAMTAYDIGDTSIENALEVAEKLSHGHRVMWALALLDAAANDGLTWISGMNYTRMPTTVRQWQHRRTMQDRYLLAKSGSAAPKVLPTGLRLIRMFGEWGDCWGIWESFTDNYPCHPSALGLSTSLAADLHAWNDAYGARSLDDPLPRTWRLEGELLYERLQAEIDGVAEVRPEFLF